MAFPKTEPEIITLAQQIESGMGTNPLMANAPINLTDFKAKLKAFLNKRDEIIVDEVKLDEKYGQKEDLEDDLTTAMKQNIGFLESITNNDPTEMATIGVTVSSGRISAPPTQPRTLEVVPKNDAKLYLDWKSPSGGGKTSAYRGEMRIMPDGKWGIKFSVKESEVVLADLPTGVPLEFRVIAFNANGDSPPSNTISVTL